MPGARLLDLVDQYTSSHGADDPVLLARARTLLFMNGVSSISLLAGLYLLLITQPLGPLSAPFALWLVAPMLLINLVSIALIRHHRLLALRSHLTLLSTFITLVAGVYFTGGPVAATANVYMIVQAIMGFFLLGLRGGLLWCLAGALTEALLFGMALGGHAFPNFENPATHATGAYFNFGLAYVAIVWIFLIREASYRQLQRARRREREHYRYLATHDSLTQLASRSWFESQLQQLVDAARGAPSQLVLLYIDLDEFKPINDNWGHATGDQVLQIVGSRLRNLTRAEDLVGRLGGDEFAVLLTDHPPERRLDAICEGIYRALSQPIHLYERYFQVTASIGVCVFPDHATSADQLWRKADRAMYRAKQTQSKWFVCDEPATT